MKSLMSYLSSPAHIGGSILAAATGGLFLVGVIEAYWLLLCVGAYAGGAVGAGAMFGMGSDDAPGVELSELPSEGKTTAEVLEWLREAKSKMSFEDAKAMDEPLKLLEVLLPHLKEMETAGAIDPSARGTLKATVKRYFPETVAAYAKIPQRVVDVKQPGRPSARQAFAQQMKLLAEHLREVDAALYGQDLNALLAQGKFLQQKLGPEDFEVKH